MVKNLIGCCNFELAVQNLCQHLKEKCDSFDERPFQYKILYPKTNSAQKYLVTFQLQLNTIPGIFFFWILHDYMITCLHDHMFKRLKIRISKYHILVGSAV